MVMEPTSSAQATTPTTGTAVECPNVAKAKSSKSDYVDFNQFIMQHNLHTTVNSVPATDGFTEPLATSGYMQPIGASNIFNYTPTINPFNIYAGANGNSLAAATTNNGDVASFNNNNYNNGEITSKTTYDNAYTPFGGPNLYGPFNSNPFGFEFGAVNKPIGTSNLLATAAEFVPNFQKLSLNDNKEEITSIINTNRTNDEQQQQQQNVFNNNNNYQEQFSRRHGGDNYQAVRKGAISRYGKNHRGGSNYGNGYLYNGGVNGSSSSSSSNGGSGNTHVQSNGSNMDKSRAEREREYDQRRNNYQQQQEDEPTLQQQQQQREQSQDANINRHNNYRNNNNNNNNNNNKNDERQQERFERSERGGGRSNGRHERERDNYHQRENHRSNKRRDDWNRNRDRANGIRLDEKYSNDNNSGKESAIQSPEKKQQSPKKIYPDNEKLSQREKLMRDIETRRLECLVCVEAIKAHHSVWSCYNCYHIMHLQCIIKWASSSKSDDGWRCPACQNVVKDVPREYYCFCGKMRNPQYNRQDLAHSCGEVCERIEGCSHACTLLCHPGPCPPCQANVKRECGCGKTSKIMQCCLKEAINCAEICGKLLNCELHYCEEQCHEGRCPPCTHKVDQKCHCHKQERQVICTKDTHDKHAYSCGKPCGRDLQCGNHKCKDCCHAGECRTCKLSPDVVTTCPCGKMPVLPGQRVSCLDVIPTCQNTCGKILRCGKPSNPHACTSKCHLGNCPPCSKQTAVKCRCGQMDQMIKCRQLSTRADDARCKKVCRKKRSCGKHKCTQECCIDIDHICPLPCNYTLSCNKHKCDQPCHRGNCPPCYRSSFDELYCECGAEVIYPPVPCGTKKPECKLPCKREHGCAHAPQHNCHSAATCPPCMIFTTQWCFGGHEKRKTIPCSQTSFGCGLACNKPLSCGIHKCIKTCHEGVCQLSGEICKQPCNKLRLTCGHKCMAVCHGERECPADTPCKEIVEVQCECGHRKQQRTCHELAREYSRITTAQLASSMAEMQRGNYMELSEILAPIKTHKTNKTLECNEECRLVERNRRLAVGLQVRNPDISQKLNTKYSDFVRNFYKKDPIMVKNIYDALTNLVKLAKDSKQKSRSHSFPTMNREKRQLVHELCEMFGVESVAYDAEPNRNVVATAHRDRAWLPAASITEIMQREAGQRRVPVPSNNAWGLKR